MANPNTAVYPGKAATDNDLYVANNVALTTLSLAVNPGDAIINVVSTASFQIPCIITIDNEYIAISGKSSNTLTVAAGGRGFDGSVAAVHNLAANVYAYVNAYYQNQLAAEVKAIEAALVYSFNVLNYGAKGDGVTDDTLTIQAAINAARNLARGPSGLYGSSARVIFPPGIYLVSNLDCTHVSGLELCGVASWGAAIYGGAQVSSSKPIIDMTGSSSCNIKGITIHGQNINGTVPSIIPSVGVLMAASNTLSSNKNRFDDVAIVGYFTIACMYMFGTTDNMFFGCAHQSQKDGTPVLIVDGDNVSGMTSNYVTIIAGSQNTGELSFFQQELHDMSTITPSTTNTLLIRSAYSVRFFGGNNANSADVNHAHIQLQGTATREITFDSVQFYGDHGVALGVVFKAGGNVVKNLTIRNCGLETTNTPILVGGVNGSVFQGLTIEGVDYAFVGIAISLPNNTSPTTVVISDARLSLSGKGISPGGSLKNVLLLNPGTITLPAGATWDNVTPPASFTFAAKPAFTVPGSQIFVTDGTSPSSPLTGGGTGAMVTYQNGALKGY